VGPDDDPAEALLSYADQLFNNATFNYNTAMELRAQVSQQEDKVIAAEQHLSEARAEVKKLKHEVENSNNALAESPQTLTRVKLRLLIRQVG